MLFSLISRPGQPSHLHRRLGCGHCSLGGGHRHLKRMLSLRSCSCRRCRLMVRLCNSGVRRGLWLLGLLMCYCFLVCGFPEWPSSLFSLLLKTKKTQLKDVVKQIKKRKNVEFLRFSEAQTFSSSSLVGDPKALLTAVNHEVPPFFPIKKWGKKIRAAFTAKLLK